MDIQVFLREMVERHASDLFFTVGAKVHMKIEGVLVEASDAALPAGSVLSMFEAIATPAQKQEFEEEFELNFAFVLEGVGRFRVNVFRQRGETAMVIRAIKTIIPTIEELKLPEVLKKVIMSPRGLILMVGSTGSGKSTSLASMIDYRNALMPGHILTIEDPIEFMYEHKKSIVNQREIGSDTKHFSRALKNAMREAPDVILIGEIRDAETMESAISFSETGHLCLATLHANNADQAIERILNFFPDGSHKNVLMNLSLNMRAIISQRLVPAVSGSRIPAVEVLLSTPYIQDIIRRNAIDELKKAMEETMEEGMESFDQCLFRLYKNGQITLEDALSAADSREGLSLKFRMSEGAVSNEGYQFGVSSYEEGS